MCSLACPFLPHVTSLQSLRRRLLPGGIRMDVERCGAAQGVSAALAGPRMQCTVSSGYGHIIYSSPIHTHPHWDERTLLRCSAIAKL